MRRPLLALLLMTVAAAPSPAQHRFVQGKSATGIPFELNSNKIYLPVRINEGDPRWFILDSGCPVTAIDMSRARELQLPVANEHPIGGVGEGRSTVGETTVRSLTLPGLELRPKSVWALAVNEPVAPYEGRRVDGLLGVDFLEQFVVRINYPERKLDIFLPEAFQPTGNEIAVPLAKHGGHYAVSATLHLKQGKSIPGRFILDVGVRLPLLLNTPFVDRHGLVAALGAGPRQACGGGLGGVTLAHLGRLEALTIGGVRVEAPYVGLSQEKRSVLSREDIDGILGAEVFRRYVLTLDVPGKRALFAETPESKKPYEYDASGMFLIARGEDFRRFEVQSVVEDSPAAQAGVEPGDLLLEVDGKPAAKLTLEQLRAAFKEAGASRVLTVQRQDKHLTVKLVLRRLV